MKTPDPSLIPSRIDAAGAVGLTHDQKRRICQLARSAWDRAGRPFLDPTAWSAKEPHALSPTEACELWRHEAQQIACGKKHLTACGQADFPLLMAHLSQLAGAPVPADHWRRRAVSDPRRQARAKLDHEIQRARETGAIDMPENYILAIATRQFRAATLDECSPNQLWSLYFTLKNRISKKLGLSKP